MHIPAEPIIFDTQNVAPSDRFRFWCDFISRRLLALDMRSASQSDYTGHIEVHGLENACMIFARGDSCCSIRGRKEIALSSEYSPDWLLMRINATAHIAHCERESHLQAGDLILIDASRPYERADSPIDCTVLAMPDALLSGWKEVFVDCAGHRFSCGQGWAKLLSAHLAGVTPELMNSIGRHAAMKSIFTKNLVCMLVQMLLHESPGVTGEKQEGMCSERARNSLYNLMLLWIQEHHDDPLVTAEHLARAFGVSLRQVHKLFATYSKGRGFLAHLQAARFEHVARLLSSEADAGTSIADISWRCGFADVSSFGRLFKRHYGMTPGAYRCMRLKTGSGPSNRQ
ncbi:helix-turn-helix domain-containing protein [Castellaniella sp. WN]